MCGIAGIISADPELQRGIEAMVSILAHRGPDGRGIARLPGAALGHRRLSIIDIAGGQQPMHSADGALSVVFNGEIYNFPELRGRLEADGSVFRTRCDTEVILHLYARYGDDCVRHLDGMFAFGLWDHARQRLLLARDHMGQKPVFFAERNGALAFASEVKALLASELFPRELDTAALYDYISLRFLPDRCTLFRGIQKLPAGHRLVYERGEARLDRFWSLSFHPKLEGTEAEITDALEARLTQTVHQHLLSDVPVGAFLSGGIDSSLMTALAAPAMSRPMPTFSIGVAEEGFNELPFAQQVATRYRTDHHESVVSADLIHLVPRMVWHLDEPADPFGVGVYLVSRLASEHVKVVLSGDGGDELFAGYDRFAGQLLAERWALLPRGLRTRAIRSTINRLPESFAYKGWTQKLRWLNEMSLEGGAARYAESMSFLRFTEAAKQELFTPATHEALGHRSSRDRIINEFNASDAETDLERMLYTDLMTRMPDHL
ncbi:MAG: asparagine synthase (glutamine-hydrolyzing), partial [Gemmatimonadota bacterium]